MSRDTDSLNELWRSIDRAGGTDAYIQTQLEEHGFLVQRRETDDMSKRELAKYKKELKAEAAEKRRLKKAAWEAYRAQHIVHLGEGAGYWNDWAVHDRWDLDEPEIRAKSNELPPLDTPQQLAEALELSIPELRWLAYHRDVATQIHYTRFTIPKRNGKERAIWAPLPKLKAAQHWILRHVAERLPVHQAAHGFLAGRSILTNAQVHTGSRLILKMDLKDFFPTVTFPRVRGIFRKAGYREQIATLLARLCTEAPREIVDHAGKRYYISLGPRSLPQGAPTSPALTNTLCLRLDQRLSGLAKKYGWRYTRYADDLTLSLPTDHEGAPHLGTLHGLIKRVVAAEGFEVHPDKTRIHRSGGRQQVTGLIINGEETPRVPRQLKRNLRAAIHRLKKGEPHHEGECLATLQGYAAYIAMTDPELGKRYLAELGRLLP